LLLTLYSACSVASVPKHADDVYSTASQCVPPRPPAFGPLQESRGWAALGCAAVCTVPPPHVAARTPDLLETGTPTTLNLEQPTFHPSQRGTPTHYYHCYCICSNTNKITLSTILAPPCSLSRGRVNRKQASDPSASAIIDARGACKCEQLLLLLHGATTATSSDFGQRGM